MKVHNVHSRELAAAPERVGELLDGLGGEGDRLWPADRWPTTPFELDGPPAVGTPSRQGQIRQVVDEYEPGRRLAFRFAPGLGLVGTHRLEVEPLAADRTRLVHTLDCRVEPKMIALYPILIRQHDALVEDLLDRAERETTGRLAGPPGRWPLSVRVANAVELRLQRRRGAPVDRPQRAVAVLVPATLAALAALHAAWALGWRWPGGDDRELADRVVGYGAEVPPTWATWAVAGLLLGAAAVVRAGATGARGPVRPAAWAVSAVLLARGLVYPPIDLARGLDRTYDRLDLAIYSPLCLALGAGIAWLLTRPGARRESAGPLDARTEGSA